MILPDLNYDNFADRKLIMTNQIWFQLFCYLQAHTNAIMKIEYIVIFKFITKNFMQK